MTHDGRSVEQKVRALLASRGLSQALFSGTRLLEQKATAADARLRFVPVAGVAGRQRFRPRKAGRR